MRAKIVVVTGDITLDWNLARSRGPEAQGPAWEPQVCSRLRWRRGGAALLADLIEGVASQIHIATLMKSVGPTRRAAPEPARMLPSGPKTHGSTTPTPRGSVVRTLPLKV